MLEPKLVTIIDQGRSAHARVRPMGDQEELLMRNVVLTYMVMCETITHMHFADDDAVRTASKELALQCLLPVAHVRTLIKYLYYENLLSYTEWVATEAEASLGRGRTVSALTTLLSEHLCANEDTLSAFHARIALASKSSLMPVPDALSAPERLTTNIARPLAEGRDHECPLSRLGVPSGPYSPRSLNLGSVYLPSSLLPSSYSLCSRWELLETFCRHEVVDKLALRPSFIQAPSTTN